MRDVEYHEYNFKLSCIKLILNYCNCQRKKLLACLPKIAFDKRLAQS